MPIYRPEDYVTKKYQKAKFFIDPLVPGTGMVFLYGKSSIGKCFASGTPILLHDGSVREVQDIRVGDLVMGPDSSARRVIETHTGKAEMYTITPSRGDSWTCNAEHLVTLEDQYGRVRHIPAKDLRLSAKKLLKVAVTFPEPKAPLPIDPYFLGVILGDGYLEHGVQVTTEDPEIVASCQEQAKIWGMQVTRKGRLTYRLVRKPGAFYPVGIRSQGRLASAKNPMLLALTKLGLMGKRSGTKFIPHQYKVATKEQRLAILAGLVDTDGYNYGSGIDFCLKSKQLALDIKFIAESLGVICSAVTHRKASCQTGAVGDYWRVVLSGEALSRMPVKLSRKLPKTISRGLGKVGFTITPSGPGKFYGFSLDGDGLFLLGDFTVAHNSPITWKMAGAITNGNSFFGMQTSKARVLYIDTDNSEWENQDRFKGVQPFPCNDLFRYWFPNTIINIFSLKDDFPEEYKQALEFQPELVIWNTLAKMQHLDIKDFNSPRMIQSQISKLFPKAAHLVVHHDNKDRPEFTPSDTETFAGSQGWYNNSISCIRLVSLNRKKGWVKLIHTKCQVAQPADDLKLCLNVEDGVTFTDLEAELAAQVRLEWEALPVNVPKTTKLKELAEKHGVTTRTIRNWLKGSYG